MISQIEEKQTQKGRIYEEIALIPKPVTLSSLRKSPAVDSTRYSENNHKQLSKLPKEWRELNFEKEVD